MKKLLIVRPEGIGDFIIFSAVLEEYTRVFKDFEIHVLCRPSTVELAKNIPFIKRVIGIDPPRFRKRYPFYYLYWVFSLYLLKYDEVVCPIYSRDVTIDYIVRLVRSEKKVFFDGDNTNDPHERRVINNYYFNHVIQSDQNFKKEIDRNAEFINKLGGNLDVKALKTQIWFSEKSELAFQELSKKFDLQTGEYICICPGSGMSFKQWRFQNWIELIKQFLGEHLSFKVVILGGPAERDSNEEIAQSLYYLRDKIIDLSGGISFVTCARFIKDARLLVSTDTGALHAAAAVGTPNICLMGGGHWGRFYPYGDLNKNLIVSYNLDCYGCNWKCIYPEPLCMKNINPADVYKKIKDIL